MHLPVTMFVKIVIDEVKLLLLFKSALEDLKSTMKELHLRMKEIESMPGAGELKNIFKAKIDEGEELIRKCSDVEKWDIVDKYIYARKMKNHNGKTLKFCQLRIQLWQLRGQLECMAKMEAAQSCTNQQPITNILASKLGAEVAVAETVSEVLGGVVTSMLNLKHRDFDVSNLEKSASEEAVIYGKFEVEPPEKSAIEEAVVSGILVLMIQEVKKLCNFKEVSEEFASTIEELLPIIKDIELLQGVEELKNFKGTIERALKMVQDIKRVKSWDLISKARYTEEIDKILNKVLKFCQLQLQVILLRNQLKMKDLL